MAPAAEYCRLRIPAPEGFLQGNTSAQKKKPQAVLEIQHGAFPKATNPREGK